MTRQRLAQDVWAWVCDWCGRTEVDDLTLERDLLPDDDEMASRGWSVAEDGDALCPICTTHPPTRTKKR